MSIFTHHMVMFCILAVSLFYFYSVLRELERMRLRSVIAGEITNSSS